MKIGDTLPNGAKILKCAYDDDVTIILAQRGSEDSFEPFVTWCARTGAPDSTACGHYFQKLSKARDDFYSRIVKGY